MVSFSSVPAFVVFLLGSVFFYALFGSPTPDHPGWVEILIGAGLICAIGIGGMIFSITITSFKTPFLKSLQVLFLCGLIVPVFSALIYDNDLSLVVRDIAAFMFLAMPLFLSSKIAFTPAIQKMFFGILVFTGIVFSIRTLLPVLNIWIPSGELLYLSNSPLVMMTAIFLVLFVWDRLKVITPLSILQILLGLMALGIVLAAMLLDVQRATIGAVFLSLLIVVFFDFLKAPKKIIFPLIITAIFIVAVSPWFIQVIDVIALKTATVGLNARVAEALAVYDVVRGDGFSFLFGRGWGAIFSSPAVAGLDVNYTHSLLTTLLLKGGVVLFLCAICVVVAGLFEIFVIFQGNKCKGLILFWSFTIPVFLYASHKSLDFGLVLLLMGLWGMTSPSLQNPSRSDRKKENQESTKI